MLNFFYFSWFFGFCFNVYNKNYCMRKIFVLIVFIFSLWIYNISSALTYTWSYIVSNIWSNAPIITLPASLGWTYTFALTPINTTNWNVVDDILNLSALRISNTQFWLYFYATNNISRGISWIATNDDWWNTPIQNSIPNSSPSLTWVVNTNLSWTLWTSLTWAVNTNLSWTLWTSLTWAVNIDWPIEVNIWGKELLDREILLQIWIAQVIFLCITLVMVWMLNIFWYKIYV